MGTDGDLWRCPRCGAGLVSRNMSHSCGRFTLDALFKDRPFARALFERFLVFAKPIGAFEVIPQKSRVSFLAKTRFAGAEKPGVDFLRIRFGLPRPLSSKRIERVDRFDRWYMHYMRLTSPADLDAELHAWLKESYVEMGLRKHLENAAGRT